MDSETRLRGRPRNRWHDEVREDGRGRLVGGKGWKVRVYNREEWKKLLRTAQNRCILHVPVELMNNYFQHSTYFSVSDSCTNHPCECL